MPGSADKDVEFREELPHQHGPSDGGANESVDLEFIFPIGCPSHLLSYIDKMCTSMISMGQINGLSIGIQNFLKLVFLFNKV